MYDPSGVVHGRVGREHTWTTAQLNVSCRQFSLKTRKLCYRRDDRAMRPQYTLFHHNFVHAYEATSAGPSLRGFDSKRM